MGRRRRGDRVSQKGDWRKPGPGHKLKGANPHMECFIMIRYSTIAIALAIFVPGVLPAQPELAGERKK